MDFGLAVTSHAYGVLNTSTFDTVTVTVGTDPTALPKSWRSGDIGDTGIAGTASYNGGTFTVRGAGEDIWSTADSFEYAAAGLDADNLGLYPLEHVQIVARVTSVQNTDPYAKAGVMIRNERNWGGTRSAQQPHVTLDVRPTGDIELLSRPAAGEPTTFVAAATHDFPVWLKLVRHYSTFTGYISSDGSAWTMVGTLENNLAEQFIYLDFIGAGLAVTSRDKSALNTSMFDHVSVFAPMMR